MELSGTVLRQVTYVSGAGSRSHGGGVRVPARARMVWGSSCFRDEGHVQYYSTSTRCGGKDQGPGVVTDKKKLKGLKALSKGLSLFPHLDHLQGNLTSDATEVLMKQLEQLRAEKKELKRMRKLEKAKRKASKRESSSSSSESSDSDCGEVVDMKSFRVGTAVYPSKVDEVQLPDSKDTMLPPLAFMPQTTTTVENPREDASAHHHDLELCSRNDTCVSSINAGFMKESSVVIPAPQKRIEVCMGNKCKKMGAAALLQEFEKVVGVEGGGVVGCKCMGKCKSAPNVRIQNSVDDSLAGGLNDSVKIPVNPLCIGIGLEDVDAIVARFLGENQEDMGMASAAT